MQLFIHAPCGAAGLGPAVTTVSVSGSDAVDSLASAVAAVWRIPMECQRLVSGGRQLCLSDTICGSSLSEAASVHVMLRVAGGMDFQNRVGSKPGMGAPASASQEAMDRRERLRRLALERVDLSKDPYFMKNHLGQFECKLCLTLHKTEGNYLAHTQGKRHQTNLSRRAAKEAAMNSNVPIAQTQEIAAPRPSMIKIGRPGYKVIKQRDPETNERIMRFEIAYPEIEDGLQPRHRFMSAFEQHVEKPDKRYQFLIFAAAPYENIAFKIPSDEIDMAADTFYTNWDKEKRTFIMQFHIKNLADQSRFKPLPAPPKPKIRYE